MLTQFKKPAATALTALLMSLGVPSTTNGAAERPGWLVDAPFTATSEAEETPSFGMRAGGFFPVREDRNLDDNSGERDREVEPAYLADSRSAQTADDAPLVDSSTAEAVSTSYAHGTADNPFSRGTWELTLNGGGVASSQFKEGSFNTQIGVGYFLTDQVEAGFRQSIQFASFGESNWAASTRVFGDYHFDFDRLQPFAGLGLSFNYGDAVADTWAAGPEVGAKYFIKDEVFLYAMVQYDVFFRDAKNDRGNFDDGQILYSFGIGFTW